MLYDPEAAREIYLCFQANNEYPCHRFFKEGFKHCFVIERQATGWVCIDANSINLEATILPATYHDEVIAHFVERNPTVTVLELAVRHIQHRNYPRPTLMSCVSTVQYLLGVWWPLTLTPYQLYTKLTNTRTKHIQVGRLWAVDQQDAARTQPRKPREQKQKK